MSNPSMVLKVVLGTTIVLSVAAPTSAACPSLDYRVARMWKTQSTDIKLSVSMAITKITPANLVCLGEVLKARYRRNIKVLALVFSDFVAAQWYLDDIQIGDFGRSFTVGSDAATVERDPVDAKQLRAIYFLDREKNQESLTIKPSGYAARTPFDTVITLPSKERIRCRIEWRSRCLLFFEDIIYPEEVYRASVSGSITVAGKVTPDGRFTDVHVLESRGAQAAQHQLLAQEALRNIQTWRLERSSVADTFRITYTWGLNTPARAQDFTLEFSLPSDVIVRANPPR